MPAVDRHDRAADVARRRRQEERPEPADLGRVAVPPERDPADHARARCPRSGGRSPSARSPSRWAIRAVATRPGRDPVDPDRGDLGGQRLDQPGEARAQDVRGREPRDRLADRAREDDQDRRRRGRLEVRQAGPDQPERGVQDAVDRDVQVASSSVAKSPPGGPPELTTSRSRPPSRSTAAATAIAGPSGRRRGRPGSAAAAIRRAAARRAGRSRRAAIADRGALGRERPWRSPRRGRSSRRRRGPAVRRVRGPWPAIATGGPAWPATRRRPGRGARGPAGPRPVRARAGHRAGVGDVDGPPALPRGATGRRTRPDRRATRHRPETGPPPVTRGPAATRRDRPSRPDRPSVRRGRTGPRGGSARPGRPKSGPGGAAGPPSALAPAAPRLPRRDDRVVGRTLRAGPRAAVPERLHERPELDRPGSPDRQGRRRPRRARGCATSGPAVPSHVSRL